MQKRPESRDQENSSLTQSPDQLLGHSQWHYKLVFQCCFEILHMVLQENSHNSILSWPGCFLMSRSTQMSLKKANYLEYSFSMMVQWATVILRLWNPSGKVVKSTSITYYNRKRAFVMLFVKYLSKLDTREWSSMQKSVHLISHDKAFCD